MANLSLSSRSPLAPFLNAGHHGAEGKTGVTLREVTGCALAELTALLDLASELKAERNPMPARSLKFQARKHARLLLKAS